MSPLTVALLLLALVLSACAPADSRAGEAGGQAAGGAPPAGEAGSAPVEPLASAGPQEPGPAGPAEPVPSPAAEDPTAALPRDCDEALACYRGPSRTGAFDPELVPEASGLAASVRNPGILYLLDDGPGTGGVWIIDGRGRHLGTVQVAGLNGRDTEDLALGPCGPGEAATCIYLGDIGDNLRQHPSIRVHRFAEPDLSGGPPQGEVAADVIDLRYPGERWDAETLLVDGDGVPHIVTKAPFDAETGETGPTRLYRAPGFAGGTLEHLADVEVPAPRLGLAAGIVGNVVTAGDSLPGRVILRTYDHVFEYVAPDPGAPLHEFPTWPRHEAPTPLLPQAEAIAYSRDACGYSTVSEQVGDLYFIACRT